MILLKIGYLNEIVWSTLRFLISKLLKKIPQFYIKSVTSRSLRIWPISFVWQEFPFRVSCPIWTYKNVDRKISFVSENLHWNVYENEKMISKNRKIDLKNFIFSLEIVWKWKSKIFDLKNFQMPTFQMLQLFSFFIKLFDIFLKNYSFSERNTLSILLERIARYFDMIIALRKKFLFFPR